MVNFNWGMGVKGVFSFCIKFLFYFFSLASIAFFLFGCPSKEEVLAQLPDCGDANLYRAEYMCESADVMKPGGEVYLCARDPFEAESTVDN